MGMNEFMGTTRLSIFTFRQGVVGPTTNSMETLSPVLSLEPFWVMLSWDGWQVFFFPSSFWHFFLGQSAKQVQNGKKCLMGFGGFFFWPFKCFFKQSPLSF
jgi:hypothetical protein